MKNKDIKYIINDRLRDEIKRGEKVALIGRNGEGKTTLMRVICSELKPLSGEAKIGHNVTIGYYAQNQEDVLDKNETVFSTLDRIAVGDIRTKLRDLLAQFLFRGEDIDKKVSVLSGGERNRLHLALTLKDEGNVLLLDEPTNDVDVNTIRALEDGLENFAGCAVVISHDRWFLDRIATHILAFEGDGSVYFFEGDYTEYEENRKARLGDEPKVFKYKKLMA